MNTKLLLALPVLAVALAGCGTTTGNDAGVQPRFHGKRPVYDMPDGYPNVSAVCVQGNLVIVVSESAAATVLPAAASCAGRDGEPPVMAR